MKIMLFLFISLPCHAAFTQGLVYFSNNYGQQVNAPVYESDGVTPLSGSQFMAELFGGLSTNSLQAITTTLFMQASAAGYFYGGTPAISTVAPRNPAWIQVDVWNTAFGSTFDQARASGAANAWWQSSVFSVVTGGGGSPPANAAPLIGLGTSPVFLNGLAPEPSALSLLLVGGLATWYRSRRHRVLSKNSNEGKCFAVSRLSVQAFRKPVRMCNLQKLNNRL
jgi:hypothetical protein